MNNSDLMLIYYAALKMSNLVQNVKKVEQERFKTFNVEVRANISA